MGQHRQPPATIPATWGRYQNKSQGNPIGSSSPTTMSKTYKEHLQNPFNKLSKGRWNSQALISSFPELHLQLLSFECLPRLLQSFKMGMWELSGKLTPSSIQTWKPHLQILSWICFYLFSKSRVLFGRGSRPSHTKIHATVAKSLGIEHMIASWKAYAILYKHTKA